MNIKNGKNIEAFKRMTNLPNLNLSTNEALHMLQMLPHTQKHSNTMMSGGLRIG